LWKRQTHRQHEKTTAIQGHCNRHRNVTTDSVQHATHFCRLGHERLNALDYSGATLHYQAALSLCPDHVEASAGLAACLDRTGHQQEAYEYLRPLFDTGVRDPALLAGFARLAPNHNRMPEAIAALQQALASEHLDNGTRADLLYALGRLLDQSRDYDTAFAAFEMAGRLKPHRFDCSNQRRVTDALIASFSVELFRRHPHPGSQSNAPIFILGMPRSGTTLVEQILSSHPLVQGGGEQETLPALASRLYSMLGTREPFPQCMAMADPATLTQVAGTYLAHNSTQMTGQHTRFTDKLPGNFLLVGFIALLFPNAPIIHVRRNPLDTCLSCFFENFLRGHAFSYNLADVGCYYQEYERLMQHWSEVLPGRLYGVGYEYLVQNPEAASRELLRHCALEWDARCLAFHENRRTVATASYDQVRRPIYTSSMGRWRHYDRHLEPLRTALAGG
jgi:tetratricopeptide (TPR) repeat protein